MVQTDEPPVAAALKHLARPLPFDRVVVIFNPNSAGNSPDNARALVEALAHERPDLAVEMRETEYAGHATELARQVASGAGATLVVSASGDGGYHEVINGILEAVADGHPDTFAAVLPSGNANDHASTLHSQPVLEAILAGDVTCLDVLSVQIDDGPPRYAHSYIGLGISPVAAVEINRHHFGAIKEIIAVTRTFWAYRPFAILHDERTIKVDSLVFANINRMAKYVTLSADGTPDDGRFEVVLIAHRSRPTLLADVLRAVTGHLQPHSRTGPYRFTTLTAMPLQLDGEVLELPANAGVTISCLPRVLASIQ